jgi:hypothetical protein
MNETRQYKGSGDHETVKMSSTLACSEFLAKLRLGPAHGGVAGMTEKL